MDVPVLIAPSILACDFGNVTQECADVLSKGADWLHVDVMDGHFVPNISIGPCVVKSLRSGLGPVPFLDCHLMVSEPEKWVEAFAEAGASGYTFHVEVVDGTAEERKKKISELAQKVRACRMKPGISVKPKTPIDSTLTELILEGAFDLVLIMTVEPGFGGQKFMADQMEKVKEVRRLCDKRRTETNGQHIVRLEVDGGLDAVTAEPAGAAGADVFVAGTAVYKAADRAAAIEAIRSNARKHLK